jgi:hypothetical protein
MKNELIQQGIRRRDDLHFERFVPIILTIAYAHDSNPRLHDLAARGSRKWPFKIPRLAAAAQVANCRHSGTSND